MKRSKINRRRFLRASALGFLGAGAAAGGRVFAQEQEDSDLDILMDEGKEAPRIRQYNEFGKTGLKVSDISLGMARDESVLKYAYDRGINFFDTAESYYQGKHELDVGRAFQGMRDKVIVITKHPYRNPREITKKKIIRRFDKSLKRLGFDYVDIAMLHQVDNPDLLKSEELFGAYEELKKQGKFRFFGFSTHAAERVCPVAFETGLFSAMMVYYNSVQYPKRSENITKAKELGIGVIAMKTMAGRDQDNVAELADERTTYSQAAIKWALSDPAVPNAVLSMRTFEHIDEYLQASGQKLTKKDQEVLDRYAMAVDGRYCRMGCELCLASCPGRVAIPDILRFGMYYENYGQEKFAMQHYAALDKRHRASPCSACAGSCESACPHGLAIRERLTRYDDLLRA